MSKPVKNIKSVYVTFFSIGILAIMVLDSGFFRKANKEPSSSILKTDGVGEKILSLSSIEETVKRTTELGKAKPVKEIENETSVLINDPNMTEKWGLKLTDSSKAWKITQGSKDIVVAVIDTGLDINHEDIAENLWINPGESGLDKNGKDKATNGIDDDGNGYVDDINGWNFVTNNNSLVDNHGHGTHISGIIGAVGGNGKGISGVSPKVSLMTLKYFDPKSLGANNLENTVKAIHYAIENGAQIINYSGGGTDFSLKEKEAIIRAQKKGILFVAAAGNERSNSDQNKYYPADYDLDNIISVTAIDPSKNILPSSNYGQITVDIAAPGKEIYSTLPNGKYGPMTGTSQATAFVSGVAALIMAHNSDYDAAKVSKYIKNTGDVVDSLKGKTRYKKKLNSYRALSILDQGVSATGVVAENIQNLPQNSFSSEKFNYEFSDVNGDGIKRFSANLMEKVKNKQAENKRQLNSDRSPNKEPETSETKTSRQK
jgi:subtilisin family serine protease